MFVVLLKFSSNKSEASRYMQGHKDWLQSGLQDGVFILAGSLQPNAGGAILAHGISLSELQERVKQDPFVEGDVVSAEILEITPSRADPRLSFLMD